MVTTGTLLRAAVAAALAIGPLAAAGAAAAQTAAGAVVLAPHRAIYDLKLSQTRGKRALSSVNGRIVYDFNGSACEGYALQFRQVTELDTGEGKGAVSDLRSATWEEGDGASFRFTSQNYLSEKLIDTVDGRAARKGEGVAVDLTKPQQKSLDVGTVVFPTEHMRRIVEAARAGKTLYEVSVYDGSESGEKVYQTLAVIGTRIDPERKPASDAAAGEAKLAGLARWPVTISYFDKSKGGGEQTPVYAISFEMYDNGISRALTLDYGDFVVKGEMSSLELREAKPCR